MDVDLSNVAAVLVVISPLALLLLRLFVVPDGVSFDDLIPPLQDVYWPRGLQEEEPVRWRIERLSAPRQVAAPPDRVSVTGAHSDPTGAGQRSKTAA
jgi:hypothetical protein